MTHWLQKKLYLRLFYKVVFKFTEFCFQNLEILGELYLQFYLENGVKITNSKISSGTLSPSQSEIWEFSNESKEDETQDQGHLLIVSKFLKTSGDSICSFEDFLFEIRQGKNHEKVLKGKFVTFLSR